MFGVFLTEVIEGKEPQRTRIGGFEMREDADACAKKEAGAFPKHGYNGENDYYWCRNNEGRQFRYFVDSE